MSDNEILMRKAEGAAAWRRLLLVVNTLCYVGWVAVFGINASGVHIILPPWAPVAALAGAAVWFFSLVAILWNIRNLRRNRALAGMLDDERTVALRGRAFQTGYWVVLFAVAVFYGLSNFFSLDIKLTLPALLALGVAVPNLTYAWLYRN